MQRMRRAAFDGAAGRDQRLPDHLSAEHALPAILRRAAAKQIHFELLDVEHIEHGLDGSGHGLARLEGQHAARDCQGERRSMIRNLTAIADGSEDMLRTTKPAP